MQLCRRCKSVMKRLRRGTVQRLLTSWVPWRPYRCRACRSSRWRWERSNRLASAMTAAADVSASTFESTGAAVAQLEALDHRAA
jgi:hypothetical protein